MLRPSQEATKRNAKRDLNRIGNKRAQLKAIVASTAQRRRHMKVRLATFSFSNDKDPP